MVFEAKLIKKISTDCPPGVQAGLNALAKTEAFTNILHKEVATRNLVFKDVRLCIGSLYRKTLKLASGNDLLIITLYNQDYTANEFAALTTFLKLKSEWGHGPSWKEGGKRWQLADYELS